MISLERVSKLGIELAEGDKGCGLFYGREDFFTVKGVGDNDIYVAKLSGEREVIINQGGDTGEVGITSFAWRENWHGIKPVGDEVMVEVMYEGCEAHIAKASHVEWDVDYEEPVFKWRPSMRDLYQGATTYTGEPLGKAQKNLADERESKAIMGNDYIGGVPFYQKGVVTDSVDAAVTTLTDMGYTFHGGTHWKPPLGVKPVFTKEMADTGELPPNGSEVVLRYMHDSKTVTHMGYVLYASRERCIILTNGREMHLLIGDYSYEPALTERDLATDDLQCIIVSQGHLNKGNISDQIASLIYDAGYRKSDK